MDDERFKRIVSESVATAMAQRGPYCGDGIGVVKALARTESKVDSIGSDIVVIKRDVKKMSDTFIAHAAVVNKQMEYLDEAKKLANEDSVEIKEKMLEAERKLSKIQRKDSYPPNGRRFKPWHIYAGIGTIGTLLGGAAWEFARLLMQYLHGGTP